MKRYILITVCMFISLSICGCTTSLTVGNVNDEDIIKEQNTELNGELPIQIDWQKYFNKTKNQFENSTKYNYVEGCSIKMDEEEKEIHFVIIVNNDTSLKDSEKVANDVVRYFNDSVHQENNSIKESGEYYLGGIYDYYLAGIVVSTDENVKNQENWYVCDTIDKGLQINPTLQEKYRIKLDEY